MRSTIVVIACLILGACGSSESEADRHIVEGSASIIKPKGEFDEAAARADAIANVAAMDFDDTEFTTECTGDCGGHKAGFEWAKENAADDLNLCSGDSDSFVEGCQMFSRAVDQQVEDMRRKWESGET